MSSNCGWGLSGVPVVVPQRLAAGAFWTQEATSLNCASHPRWVTRASASWQSSRHVASGLPCGHASTIFEQRSLQTSPDAVLPELVLPELVLPELVAPLLSSPGPLPLLHAGM